MNYEEKLKELDKIAKKLEGKDVPIADALELLRKAAELSGAAIKELDEAKGQITLITKTLDGIAEREFDVYE